MIEVTAYRDRPIAVMGLGKSGISAVRALTAGGADVWAWDDGALTRQAAEAEDIALTDLNDADWQGIDTLVLSPGIADRHPAPHPIADKARAQGCDIICDVDLLARTIDQAAYVGITGTNGKSTTSALIGHILKQSGRIVEVGGNFGVPALDLQPLNDDGTYVLELSSYQLERIPSVALDVAILLNISPDHLDRHGGMEGYVAAKKIIFERAKDDGRAIIGMEDSHCRGISLELMMSGEFQNGKNIIPISASGRVAGGVYVDEAILIDDTEYGQSAVLDLSAVASLPGRHNWQNAAAAFAAARAAGVAVPEIAGAIETFAGLAHRQEVIRIIDRVSFVNDSKATNSQAAAKALACYGNIHWIAGGQFKEDSLDLVTEALPGVRTAYLIGEAQDRFKDELNGKTDVRLCGDLDQAVKDASTAAAESGEPSVVLLSPACASFDQFDNFEARGERFRELVGALS